MCGIAGFADITARARTLDGDRQRVKAMCDVMRHRGPDDDGFYVEPGVALGMRRLSIIDLAGGHQPIHNEERTVWVVFNGEIYNYRELRDDARGRRAPLLHVERHGNHRSRVRGMGRGRVLAPPRHVRHRHLGHAHQHAAARPRPPWHQACLLRRGRRALVLRFGGQVPPGEPRGRSRTRPRGARPLPGVTSILRATAPSSAACASCRPRTVLKVHGGKVEVQRYWQLPVRGTFAGSEADALEQLERTLGDAVRSHLVSDVPLGAFLSGGIDSSVVVGADGEGGEPAGQDVLHRLRRSARTTSCRTRARWPSISAPIITSSWYGPTRSGSSTGSSGISTSRSPTPRRSRPGTSREMARQHVTVVLSGDGGDELFGGYDRYLPHPRVARSTGSCLASAARSRRPPGARCRMACAARTSSATSPAIRRDGTSTR